MAKAKTKKRIIKPTELQLRFIDEKLKGKSNYRAAIDAGYSENTASDTTKNILEKPGVQSQLDHYRNLLRTEIPIEDRINTIHNGLRAFKQDITGQPYEDHPTRLQFLKYVDQLDGIEIKQKADVQIDGDLNVQIVNFSGSSTDEDTI